MNDTVSVRKQGKGDIGIMTIVEFADFIKKQIENQLVTIDN